MKTWEIGKEIKTSVLAIIVLGLICCGLYPLVVTVLGQVIFHRQANGSLVLEKASGKVIASELIGQAFNGASYFNPRPSAAGNGYDPTSSGGSNLGPTAKALVESVKQRVLDYRKSNGLADTQLVPADAVTASGSGLDPQISLKNALLQLPRVARERKLTEGELTAIVNRHTERPDWGIFGETRVNVVMLNLDLDGKLK